MMNSRRNLILCVDDEEAMLESYCRMLRSMGHTCVGINDSEQAIAMIERERPKIVLTDLKMPHRDGIEILESTKRVDPAITVILITAYATIQSAVEAVKKGAFDYIPKPFSFEQLQICIEKALAYQELEEENRNLRSQLADTFSFHKIVGESPTIQRTFETIRKVARTEANVLIYGESGTGKELIARSIHANSARSGKGFVPVDCASLPENLLESELFGHEKGAFTGAFTERPGLFEFANGGTIFLDEISELAPSTQAKLLRVLQEYKVRRVGGREEIEVDIRIISATNRDLQEAVNQKSFRDDLFYRINVIFIPLPPLREREGDVILIANHYLREFSKTRRHSITRISPQALQALGQYGWPGNVRELRNVIERAVSLTESDEIALHDLPESIVKGKSVSSANLKTLPLKDARRALLLPFEHEYLQELMEKHGGNISRAAETAKVDRVTLHRLLKKHNLNNLQP